MKRIKKIRFRWMAFLFFVLFLLYIILGALLPFSHVKQISEEYKKNSTTNIFYETDRQADDRAFVVETNKEALDLRIQMINQAKKRIILSTFDIRSGESTSDVFAALYHAAERGVSIQILVDGLYGTLHMSKDHLFLAAGSHPNIEIRFYNIPNILKPWTINGRMHDKYVLVDDTMLLAGGRNTFDYFLGNYIEKNLSYDREVFIYNTLPKERSKDSAIFQMEHYFQQIWEEGVCKTVFDTVKKSKQKSVDQAKERLLERYEQMQLQQPVLFEETIDVQKKTIPVDSITLISNPIHILAKEPYVWYELYQLMLGAKERVYIHTPYLALSDDMYRELTEVSANVPVTILLNSVAVGDNFMASSDYIFQKKNVLETKAALYEFQGEYSSHGKSLMIDHNISIIGSYNLDMRSTYVDTEVMFVIRGEEFQQQLEEYIKQMEKKSLKVREDGTYEESNEVEVVKLSTEKKALFRITSVVFQLFRYLI